MTNKHNLTYSARLAQLSGNEAMHQMHISESHTCERLQVKLLFQ